ncbi:hypothetical protein ACJIZ3_019557 [Penstemon smallii]|uniref:Uncharacterized protein n=1 Tax=Penstemon smallii TaxID=265156 RepID=A0ABD3T2G2_9LAMI
MGQVKDHDFQKSPPPTAPPTYGQPSLQSQPQNYSQQLATNIPVQHGDLPGQWSTGLCDCFDDVPNCCMTCWCPCITFGRIADIVDQGSTSGALYTLISCVTGISCIYSYFYREKMRKQYMLQGDTCNDCLLHCFCESCALCQEYRELQNRGFDMTLGWKGNVEKQNQGVTMAPFMMIFKNLHHPQHHHPTANHQPLAYRSNTGIFRGNGPLAFVTASTMFQIHVEQVEHYIL